MELYHGSQHKFDKFNLENLGENGTAQGFGIYLTPNIDMAGMYAHTNTGLEDKTGYLYRVNADLENELSLDDLTISRDKLSDIIDYLHRENDILYDYGDIDFIGIDSVKNNVIEMLIDNNENDIDLMNDLANTINDHESIANAFFDVGKYTHAVAKNQLRQNDDVFIVFDTRHLEITDVFEISNKDQNLEISTQLSLEENYYFRACNLYSLSNEKIGLNDDKTIDLILTDKYKTFDSMKDLFNEKFEQRFKDSLDVNFIDDIESSLGKDCVEFILSENIELKKIFAKEIDLDNDGTPDRTDYNNQNSNIQNVGDMKEIENGTTKEHSREKRREREEMER